MSERTVRILVISDMHALEGSGGNSDSYLYFSQDGECEYADGLMEHLTRNISNIDLLICAGDISNKACVRGFEHGWRFLNKLRERLAIPEMVCVPGNHDHRSLSDPEKDVFCPKHHLQFMFPPFPFQSREANTHFWAWNWVSQSFKDFNLIALNTSAYHGYDDEWKHGRVAMEVCDQINTYVSSESFERKSFNVLVCHHHPMKMEMVDRRSDVEVMEGGQYLLNKLQELDKGPWLIIHGHKHYAFLDYSSGSSGSQHTILSAGSLSAKLYDDIKERTSNQFYIVDVDLNLTEENEQLVGKFHTYEWKMSSGWRLSESPNLPGKGGFGSKVALAHVENKIDELIKEKGKLLKEEDLSEVCRMIEYFPPRTYTRLLGRLDNKGLVVESEYDRIVEIGAKK